MTINLNKDKSELEYYYSENSDVFGPFTVSVLLTKIKADTVVFREGIEWTPAKEIDELKNYFRQEKIIEKQEPVKQTTIAKPIVEQQKSNTGGLWVFIILLILAGVGYYFYNQNKMQEQTEPKAQFDEQKNMLSDELDDLMHGKGTYTYANGDKYVGEFKDDLMHGQGTYTYANGDKYVGEFKDDMMHGQGTYTYADGTIEKGLWENDEFLDKEVSAKNEEDTEDHLIIGEIDDPDGYTNVRKKPSSNSEIIYKIYKGESFFLSDTSGLWWTVISKNDIGFIHRSRVRIISN